jgi:hypothetical protein
MIHFKGVVEKEIGGKKVFFKFNMAALSYFADLQGLTIQKLGIELSDPKFSTIANFFYAGAVTYCRQEKKPQEFTQDDALEWIGIIGFEEAVQLFADAFVAPVEKNQPAPTTGHSKTTRSQKS